MPVDLKAEFMRLIAKIDAQTVSRGGSPSHNLYEIGTDEILMLDGATIRDQSAMLKVFYEISGSWRDAILGKGIIPPPELSATINKDTVKYQLSLRRENFWPDPPYADEDLRRCTFLAIDYLNFEETYLWWRYDGLDEPMIVDFFCGSVRYFKTIYDMLLFYGDDRLDLSIDLLEELKSERADL